MCECLWTEVHGFPGQGYICRSHNVCKVLSCVNVWTKPCKGLWAKKDTNLVPVQATHQYTGTGQFKDSSKVCSNEPHFTQ